MERPPSVPTSSATTTAIGLSALFSNTAGAFNTAVGVEALFSNTIGNNNTALGFSAGLNQTTGGNNVYIGAGISGVAGESDACYIGSIFAQTSASGTPVLINSFDKLGTTTSSKRFKEEIKPMDKASKALLALKPVTFRYKKEIDPAGTSQFGLVAEDVEAVNPDLIVRDKEGKPYSVRYEQVNAMLLNEFLKEHRKVQEQEANIAQLKKDFRATVAQLTMRLDEQAAQIQRVSAQLAAASPSRGGLEASKFATGRIRGGGPAPQVVNNP
jgi:Chaperone of endosialidase